MDIDRIAAEIGASPQLNAVAAKLGLSPQDAQAILHAVLDHAASGGAPQAVTGAAAARSGVAPAKVQQFLPEIMALLQGHAANAPPAAQGELGGLLGSVESVLGGGAGGSSGGLLGAAESLFGRR